MSLAALSLSWIRSIHLDAYRLCTNHAGMNASTRAERIEIRATLELKASLEKAAQLQDQTLSAFVLTASRDAASRVLSDQTRLLLPAIGFYQSYDF